MGRCDYFEKECDKHGKCTECLNPPDMREKVKEYIGELEDEIQRCLNIMVELTVRDKLKDAKQVELESRIQTLEEVKNDLRNRMEEVI